MYNDVLINGSDITEIPNFKVNNVVIDAPPDFAISSGKLARRDGIKVYNKEAGERNIYIEGYFTAHSRHDYLTARSALLKVLVPAEKVLQVPVFNRPLEFTGTCKTPVFSDVGGGGGKVVITFMCSDPFGYDRDARTIINGATVTSATTDISLLEAVGGDYETPGTFTITVGSVTGGTGKYIDLSNQTGENIRITRNWVTGDVLVLNMKDYSCKVNGATVDYTGGFWNMAVGDLTIGYEDNFTTRSVNVMGIYKRRNQ